MRLLIHSALISLLAVSLQTTAQSRVCIGGDLDHLTAAQKGRCLASAAKVRSEATRFNAPADWHFFIVCTEADWKAYAAFSDRAPEELENLSADTNLARRTTFFRGETIATSEPVRLQLAVAHEVASALLKTSDELAIQDRIALLVPGSERHENALRASR